MEGSSKKFTIANVTLPCGQVSLNKCPSGSRLLEDEIFPGDLHVVQVRKQPLAVLLRTPELQNESKINCWFTLLHFIGIMFLHVMGNGFIICLLHISSIHIVGGLKDKDMGHGQEFERYVSTKKDMIT